MIRNQTEFERTIAQLLVRPNWERDFALNTALDSAESKFTRNQIRALLRIAQADSEWTVRDNATQALALYGSVQDVPCLADRLADRQWVVRASAVSAIAAVYKRRAKKYILPILDDPHPVVRRDAAIALWDAIGNDAIPILTELREAETHEYGLDGCDIALAEAGADDSITRLKERAWSSDPWAHSPARRCLRRLGIEEAWPNPPGRFADASESGVREGDGQDST